MSENKNPAPAVAVKVKPLEWKEDGKYLRARMGDREYMLSITSDGETWAGITRPYVFGYNGNWGFVPNCSFVTLEVAKAACQADCQARHGALSAQVQDARSDDEEEIFEIGVREGYERAVQEIDIKTGGDGEYRYCTDHDPERHTPDAPAMIQRIVDRFETLNLIGEAEKRGDFWDAPGSAQVQDVVGNKQAEHFRTAMLEVENRIRSVRLKELLPGQSVNETAIFLSEVADVLKDARDKFSFSIPAAPAAKQGEGE